LDRDREGLGALRGSDREEEEGRGDGDGDGVLAAAAAVAAALAASVAASEAEVVGRVRVTLPCRVVVSTELFVAASMCSHCLLDTS